MAAGAYTGLFAQHASTCVQGNFGYLPGCVATQGHTMQSRDRHQCFIIGIMRARGKISLRLPQSGLNPGHTNHPAAHVAFSRRASGRLWPHSLWCLKMPAVPSSGGQAEESLMSNPRNPGCCALAACIGWATLANHGMHWL